MARSKRVKNKPFPFLKLPLELRFIVYRELLKAPPMDNGDEDYLAPDPLDMESMFNRINRKEGYHAELGILKTSKSVHREATQVLYGENSFWFSEEPYQYFEGEGIEGENKVFPCNLLQVSRFFKMIGPRNVSKIRRVCFELQTESFILPPWQATGKDFSADLARSFHQLSLHNNLTKLEFDLKQESSKVAFREMVENECANPLLREALFSLRVKKLVVRPAQEPEPWVYEAMESIQVKPPVRSLHRIWY